MFTIVEDLVFDIGLSEENDVALYLDKGFRVVSVEADRRMHAHLCKRFEDAIVKGKLVTYHAAAHRTADQELTFWHNDKNRGLSSFMKSEKALCVGMQTVTVVETID